MELLSQIIRRRGHLFGRMLLLGTTVAGLGFGAYHRTPLTELSDSNALPSALVWSNALLKRLSDDVYELGLVRLDKSKRSVSFPGAVNMSDGQVEYALVQASGKVHESVLKTDADPYHIHLARLLVGPSEPAPQPTDARSPRELAGARISIWVTWTTNRTEKRVRLEDLVSNTLTKSPMSRGDWVYNGSRLVQGTFLAQRDGSIVAIIADPDALVNSPRPGREDDEIWIANRSVVPPVGTPVEVTIQLADNREN